ncbi:NUDIX domain-containing protein [Neochlamydia sp. AcF95]|uniref:NUDIX hydrolase n=1 Tax=Neochlamydia sp. AcF95 TaxID=2795734 RepID=UPI001BC91A52|nr:NUDIX domain-containing protein [Neochlamydia sp. AcF95]MBS4170962.1 Uncharacterized protein [Neochlamydia sp. AcF95]
MEKQCTATAYIFDHEKVLLVFHRKLSKWLPPGGHMYPHETPPMAAKREAKEETGLEVEIILQENIWIERWNAHSFERPYLCLLEEIPPFGDQPAHQHVDFIYITRPIGGEIRENPGETNGIRWFTLDEIEALNPDGEIFVETQQTLRHLFLRGF